MRNVAVVVPVHCEAANLFALHRRISLVANTASSYSWRFIFINDGSTDNSYALLCELAKRDSRVTVLDLSRNFGKEVALTAGVFEASEADAVVCMDADLQHPPELMIKLLVEWENGADVVVTVRTSLAGQTLFRRAASFLFYWIMRRISNVQMVPNTPDYRLYDKKVLTAFKLVTERQRMFRGIMDWLGFKRATVHFDADARSGGSATYSTSDLWRLAINSVTSFSLAPLRLTGYLGGLICLVSGLLLCWMLANYLYFGYSVYTPLALVAVTNTFLIGIVLVALWFVALYVGSIHTEVLNRPLYAVRERLNFSVHPEGSEPVVPDTPRSKS